MTAYWWLRQGHWRPLVLALVAGALCFLAVQVPWAEVIVALHAANLAGLAGAALLNAAVFPLWVWQWRIVAGPFRQVGWAAMCGAVGYSILGKVTVSGLAGVSTGLLALRYRCGLSLSQAGTVISVDQIFALLTKLLVFALALWLLPLPEGLRAMAIALAGLAGMLLAGLVLLHRLGRALPAPVQRFVTDLAALGTFRVLAGGVALALIKKTLEIAAALAVQRAVGIDAPAAAAILVVAAVSVTTLVPVVPANLGTHSAGVFAAYAVLGVGPDQAVAAGLLHHATVLAGSLGAALAGLGLARR